VRWRAVAVVQARAGVHGESADDMNAIDIATALKGRRSSAGWICLCPAHDDHDPSLSVIDRDGKVLVKCRTGCPQDAVIDALKRKGLWDGKPQNRDLRSESSAARSGPATDPMKSFRNASPFIRATAVDRYLQFRKIKLTDEEARSLRFSPALWHWPTRSRWPAMLARVSLATGVDLTTHQTFLKPDGSGKAPLGERARLFVSGGRTVGGGVWFGAVAYPTREFIVGEGIESVLSAMRIFDAAAGCAALSELGVRRLILPSEVRRVRIFADNDDKDSRRPARPGGDGAMRGERSRFRSPIELGKTPMTSGRGERREQRAHSLGGADVR
jgi:putative DNA primase/helicase